MDSFDKCREIESVSLNALLPIIQRDSFEGRFVVPKNGPAARYVQLILGDVIYTDKQGTFHIVEIKTEKKYTGNFFLEVWSNRTFGPHQKDGWMKDKCCDLLFYYFQDNHVAFVLDFKELWSWAFERRNEKGQPNGRLHDFRMSEQLTYDQKNKTVGAIVPVEVIHKEVGFKGVYRVWPGRDFLEMSQNDIPDLLREIKQ